MGYGRKGQEKCQAQLGEATQGASAWKKNIFYGKKDPTGWPEEQGGSDKEEEDEEKGGEKKKLKGTVSPQMCSI